ncbi:hypothetical protein GJ496_002302, partial [Pomphorhynchus laevis]
ENKTEATCTLYKFEGISNANNDVLTYSTESTHSFYNNSNSIVQHTEENQRCYSDVNNNEDTTKPIYIEDEEIQMLIDRIDNLLEVNAKKGMHIANLIQDIKEPRSEEIKYSSNDKICTETEQPTQELIETDNKIDKYHNDFESDTDILNHRRRSGSIMSNNAPAITTNVHMRSDCSDTIRSSNYRSNSMSLCIPLTHCYSPSAIRDMSGRWTVRSDMSGYNSDGPASRSSNRRHCKPNIFPFEKNKIQGVKGIKAIFGRLIRANSGSVCQYDDNFCRGSSNRSTTLSCKEQNQKNWSSTLQKLSPVEVAFGAWTRDQVCAWLAGIGLEMYVPECHSWLKNGLELINASSHTLEKELGMKNPLHRKKLKLCLQSLCGTVQENENIRKLDLFWVQRWLDDIGLPQYKDQFHEAKIDGRMLHHMTVDDLLQLCVSNELHHLSIKRAIQILRIYGFHPRCLRRRPVENDKEHVMLWTNHRVMEWLRDIDLSEYAPNLRGSGVHGALIILEPRFDSECLADILAIPNLKTLLRRHLSNHFINLVGQEVYRKKMELMHSHHYFPLDVHAKVKLQKKFFSYRKPKTSSDIRSAGLVCPVGDIGSFSNAFDYRSQCKYNQSPIPFADKDKHFCPNYDQIAMSTMKVVKKHSPTTFV